MAITKTGTGTTLGISATLPTTFDGQALTGYPSLTFTPIGEVIDPGEIAKVWATVNHQTVDREYPVKIKDTYDIPNFTFTLGRDITDAGQVLLAAAMAAAESYSFELTLPNTNKINVTGKVLKAGLGAVATGAVLTTVVEIAVDPETIFEV